MTSLTQSAALASVLFFLGGCAGTLEATTRADLGVVAARIDLQPRGTAEVAEDATAFDGSLGGYLAYALRKNPTLRASFQRWRAATLRISRARRLPEPTISYGYFVRSVETRVGPQRHRFGLSQTFPWPTKLTAGSDAAAAAARASQRRFDAQLLVVTQRVADTYWRLWLIDEEHRLKSEHDHVLETLAGTVRGRVQTSGASLADLNQIDLGVARHHDHHGQHREARRAAEGDLLAILGAPPGITPLLVTGSPAEGLPADNDSALRASAHAHPAIDALELLATASDSRAEAEAADRLPRLRVGFDYIETGEASMPDVPGSGTDPIVVSLALSVPLWWSSYSDAEEAARADAAAHRASRDAARQRTNSEMEAALASIRDAERRVQLYRGTLLPQAQTTFRAVLGGYQTGRSTVAAGLLAERDLLELRLGLARARADHVRAWARLERVVGRDITAASPENNDE